MVWDALSFSVREELRAHPNAIGALFTMFARSGAIERTGVTVPSQRKKARGRRIPLWRVK